jgi:hypothetical protein
MIEFIDCVKTPILLLNQFLVIFKIKRPIKNQAILKLFCYKIVKIIIIRRN